MRMKKTDVSVRIVHPGIPRSMAEGWEYSDTDAGIAARHFKDSANPIARAKHCSVHTSGVARA